MKSNIPSFLLEQPSSAVFTQIGGKLRKSFIEKGIHHLAHFITAGYIQWETASKESVFQRIDARIKVLFLLTFIIIVSLKKDVMSEILLGGFVFVLALISHLNIFRFYRKVLLLGFFFGFLIGFPSAFNIITAGEIVLPVYRFSQDYHFWVYHVPKEIGITGPGLSVVAMLTLRVVNSLSLSFLILCTTPFHDIIKALKILKVPDSILMVITLSYKYIFIFAKTLEDMHLAKKSRLAGQVNHTEESKWVAGRIAFIFKKTRLRCEEIFKAMLSRGFSQDIKFYEQRKLKFHDMAAGGILFLFAAFFLWM